MAPFSDEEAASATPGPVGGSAIAPSGMSDSDAANAVPPSAAGMNDQQASNAIPQNLMNPMRPPQSFGVPSEASETIQRGLEKAGSVVGTALTPLSWPLRAAAGLSVRAASAASLPGGKELESQIFPKNASAFHQLVPDSYFSDITDFYMDKADQAMGISQAGEMYRGLYAATKFGVGLGANILGDPLTHGLVQFGTLTKAAEEAAKIGAEGAGARNLIELKNPFTGDKTSVSMDALRQAMPAAMKIPDAMASGWNSATRAFSPDTGIPFVDRARSAYDAMKRGAPIESMKELLAVGQKSYTPEENALQWKLMEQTPNIAPNLPEKLISAAGGKLSATDEEVMGKIQKLLPSTAEQTGVTLAPGRAEDIANSVLRMKQRLAGNLETLHAAGTLNEANIAEKVMENYAPRVLGPDGIKAQAQLAKNMAKDTTQMDRAIKGSWLSSTDPMRYREATRGMNFEEAQAAMKEASGAERYFVDSPHVAVETRVQEAKKLLRDSQLLDAVSATGIRPKSFAEATALARKGWAPIDHPEFNGKTVIIKASGEGTQKAVFRDLLFPKEVASKMSYFINPPAVGNMGAAMNYANRIFRSTSFLSPGFGIRNAMANEVKILAQGTTMEAHKGALMSILDKDAGFRGAANAINKSGVFYSGQAFKDLVDTHGIATGNAFREGMNDFVAAGKKLTLSQAASDSRAISIDSTKKTVNSMIHGVHAFGESGENFTRIALFRQRLMDGYTPEAAAREVEKYLFDYNRNSQLTDKLRILFPFIQHPLKTLAVAPDLLSGGGASVYNLVHNSFPHVLAAAFHDPMTQAQLGQLVPGYVNHQDSVFGPMITGNSLLASYLLNPKTPGNMGSVVYFKPGDMGMGILNALNPLSQEAQRNAMGLGPLFKGLIGLAFGMDPSKFGTKNWSLDRATPGDTDLHSRIDYALREGILGNVNLTNTTKLIEQSLGLGGDPKFFEPATVRLMQAAFGQFGGITSLDKELLFRQFSFAPMLKDLKSQLFSAQVNMQKVEPGPFENQVRSSRADTAMNVYKEVQQKVMEMQNTQSAAQGIQGKVSPQELASRIQLLKQNVKQANEGYQLGIQRYLDLSKGARSPQEARAKAGVDIR